MTTLVLVHGCGNDRRFWDELLPHLGALEVYAPSLPGRGDTGGDAMQSAADAAAWVLTDLDARGIERGVPRQQRPDRMRTEIRGWLDAKDPLPLGVTKATLDELTNRIQLNLSMVIKATHMP